MNEEQLQTILTYLDKIARKLNIGVQQIWPWFIKQQFVDAFVSLGIFLTAITVNIIFLSITIKFWRKDNKYDKNLYYYKNGEKQEKEKRYAYSIYHQNHEPIWITANSILMILTLIAGLVFCANFFDILNPEYSAFKDIISLLPPTPVK